MKRFVYKGREFDFDDSKLLLHEGIWWERVTGYTARQIQHSWANGGALGIACWLILAARRNGAHDVAFEQVLALDVNGDDHEFNLIDLDRLPSPVDAPGDGQADAEQPHQEQPDPTQQPGKKPPSRPGRNAKGSTSSRSPRKSTATSPTS